MEQRTGSQLGKEYVMAVYCHAAYLTYMQSLSCEMPGWVKHNWNQCCREKYQSPQICRWHHPYGRKQRGTKEPLWWQWKRRVKKLALNLTFKKWDHGIWSHHFMANRWGNSERLYFLGLQNHCRWWLQPWKLKDACSLEEKLWPTQTAY